MIINILCDDKNSWFWDKNNNLIKEIEKKHTLNLIQNQKEFVKGDIAVFISCNKLVENQYLALNKSNIVCHPSNLPKGRGFSPIAWEILDSANKLTFTLFEANEKIDDGDIYYKKEVELSGTELNDDLRSIQAEITFELILKYINEYPNINGSKQIGEATYYKKRNKDDMELDIKKSIEEQFNLLRIADNVNYPAHFHYKNQKYILKIEKEY